MGFGNQEHYVRTCLPPTTIHYSHRIFFVDLHLVVQGASQEEGAVLVLIPVAHAQQRQAAVEALAPLTASQSSHPLH